MRGTPVDECSPSPFGVSERAAALGANRGSRGGWTVRERPRGPLRTDCACNGQNGDEMMGRVKGEIESRGHRPQTAHLV